MHDIKYELIYMARKKSKRKWMIIWKKDIMCILVYPDRLSREAMRVTKTKKKELEEEVIEEVEEEEEEIMKKYRWNEDGMQEESRNNNVAFCTENINEADNNHSDITDSLM